MEVEAGPKLLSNRQGHSYHRLALQNSPDPIDAMLSAKGYRFSHKRGTLQGSVRKFNRR
jgi:hypothetical protein